MTETPDPQVAQAAAAAAAGQAWINTTDYTPLQLALFAVSGGLWVIVYALVIRGIVKRRFVEIPAPACVANISWEIVWTVFFKTNFGLLFEYGYRCWLLLDIFIIYKLLQYGHEQVQNETLKKYFKPITLLSIVATTAMLYFYVAEGYDTAQGLNSGFMTTVLSASLYCLLFVRLNRPEKFSYPVAWTQFASVGFATLFVLAAAPENRMMLTLALVTMVFLALYAWLFTRARRNGGRLPAEL
ncbi:MAG: hypothetical protein AAF725_08880 [Acidobacteriota bacterium]